VNLVFTLCDAGDSVVMYAPYYFNAYLSFQMTGVTNIVIGESDPKTLNPDVGKMSILSSFILERVV
jgi:aromatic aminotransferase